ncbi:electron transport complex subunit E [Ruminococcaceae bacterium OttesenSCG-928-I18]|nr:electron transport complex subunit E [Ruminococcaceae bacterium OttesenSCG-928-I18]
MKQKVNYLATFTNGILKENPVLRLVLGCCPVLAITTAVFNGIGMGAAATFVLICSNVVISLLRKVIPSGVRLPCYIVIIASFVTLVSMIVKAYVPALDESLGVFLPLITVNCIILGRAEMFASKNGVFASALDGLGMGIGFTLALVLMSAIREILGAGQFFGLQILPESVQPMSIMILPPGGFFVFGILMALAVFIERKTGKPLPKNAGCAACPAGENCPGNRDEEAEEVGK